MFHVFHFPTTPERHVFDGHLPHIAALPGAAAAQEKRRVEYLDVKMPGVGGCEVHCPPETSKTNR